VNEEPEEGRKRRDRDGFRFTLGVLVLVLILGAGAGVLLMQPKPVRFAGWTFVGPMNRQKILVANASIRTVGPRPNGAVRFKAKVMNFGTQWKPTPKLQVLSPRVYHYGFFTLIQQ
jgi:hypothetical protein